MKISVITPFYRGNDYLKDLGANLSMAVSFLDSEDALEWILVNDSPDTPVDETKITSLASERFSIRVLDNEINSGIHASRIRGLSASEGDWILFLDQDDAIAPEALMQWAYAVRKNGGASDTLRKSSGTPDAVVCNARLMQKDGSALLWFRTEEHKQLLNDFDTWISVGTQIISPGQVLIRKDAIPAAWTARVLQVNGSDDYYLWLLMLAEERHFAYLDAPLYTHRYTGSNLSEDTRRTDDSAYEFLQLLQENPAFPPKACRRLSEMIAYKAAFRAGGIGTKLWETAKHPGLFLANLRYKKVTKTGYGFNR